jgi:HSP20 family protein
MNRLEQQFEKLFNGRDRSLFGVRPVYPLMNLWEDDDNLYVEAELPGLDVNDLEIHVTGSNQLSIKGQRNEPDMKDRTWHRQERGFGQFVRVLDLPQMVDNDKVTAEAKNGVLTVTLPKQAAAKPRRISVSSS